MFRRAARRTVIQRRILVAELAVAAFTREHDQIPQSLDELVPEYLEKIPKDPFRPGPLCYRGGTIYSVGPDGVDDGGDLLDWEDYPWEERGDLGAETVFDWE